VCCTGIEHKMGLAWQPNVFDSVTVKRRMCCGIGRRIKSSLMAMFVLIERSTAEGVDYKAWRLGRVGLSSAFRIRQRAYASTERKRRGGVAIIEHPDVKAECYWHALLKPLHCARWLSNRSATESIWLDSNKIQARASRSHCLLTPIFKGVAQSEPMWCGGSSGAGILAAWVFWRNRCCQRLCECANYDDLRRHNGVFKADLLC